MGLMELYYYIGNFCRKFVVFIMFDHILSKPPSSDECDATEISKEVLHLMEASLAPRTLEAYHAEWERLSKWLNGRPISDELLAEYLATLYANGLSPASISMVLATVRCVCRLADQQPPMGSMTSRVMGGIRRKGRGRGRGQVAPIRFKDADRLISSIETETSPSSLEAAARDAALISTMSDGMLRVSELIAVRWRHLYWEYDGSGRLMIPVSKSDQEGHGAVLYLGPPTVDRLQKWDKMQRNVVTDDHEDFVFTGIRRGGSIQTKPLTRQSVRRMIVRHALQYLPELFHKDQDGRMKGGASSHSFRIGSAQSLARRGATLPQLQTAGRWKSPSMPASYCRNEEAGTGAMARLRYGRE